MTEVWGILYHSHTLLAATRAAQNNIIVKEKLMQPSATIRDICITLNDGTQIVYNTGYEAFIHCCIINNYDRSHGYIDSTIADIVNIVSHCYLKDDCYVPLDLLTDYVTDNYDTCKTLPYNIILDNVHAIVAARYINT